MARIGNGRGCLIDVAKPSHRVSEREARAEP